MATKAYPALVACFDKWLLNHYPGAVFYKVYINKFQYMAREMMQN